MPITGAIGPLISVAIPNATPAGSSFSCCIIQTPRTIKAVKLTSIRAVCADPHTISDVAQTNAAIGPPIRHTSQIKNKNAMSDGSTNAHIE